MDQLIVTGGKQLRGTVTPSGNKNAAQPTLIATLLTDEDVTLRNVPDIMDIRTIVEILQDIGVQVTRRGPNELTINAGSLNKTALPADLCRKVRGAFMFAGPLVARHGEATIPRPGGDRIGRRRIDSHIQALEAMGAEVDTDQIYSLKAPKRLHGADVFLDERSVTATENALMAAVLAAGQTVIRNAASEPHVQELCQLLNKMGGNIVGVGTNELTIEGVKHLHGAEHTIGPDYMEVGSLIGLAAVTDGDIRIKDAAPQNMRRSLMVFRRLGVDVQIDGDDLVIPPSQKLEIIPDIGDAIPKIDDDPWPGFPADLMSVAIVVATQSRGTVLFFEKMFESRMFWLDRLIEMGAKIILCDPHRAVVVGPAKLHGEHLSSPDIRAGMALLIASLGAEGESVISNIEQIDRGYERIDERLRQLGADITRVSAHGA
ncbi:MAG: UDP-N-acetylglucosamine 1-carboxyvinyltransferase [Gemmatimonadetes bacterium]|jgi:UDP-N-acetylglucosamine 1-carboxyvinyltransferase|nr:UDP-N-acetylglucosamine 1-carboxyvinyltransferase [Gemmatimonadota bacterium]MBT4611063.1 UDP-N-acetylglucosamine 1-carboxyvinyltransferase [Gemmatimonadota bacterium]MBT5057768.1 UDP-N-acetylglucosamine 1-carboxyvinyltransferase [Gemmatimonadota bacterium]MBT5141320.1 UDP-N-acetylglucosamine 1-carboxyvinyltransferase [Gemmatimonadota bacterium]MBT5590401.1 UDP-N-acetylglucosamine 1-carboxyvinyltransferase [Gemmatimonadota bacterium]